MMDALRFFTLRRLRLLSGIVMFAYIAIHLLNHGLGIISLAVAETGLRFAMVFWRTPIMWVPREARHVRFAPESGLWRRADMSAKGQ